ncbi:YhcN/YlaJ family sporulation lipoprotein [Aquisalibacillus elongatus]|uniref:YhcN/YlaJ family sporulation lipoprotein n=1 Tax=Aquisalibacillus elongatus TaxID=485577 RepID=A0A3N5AYW5_9BACI|nr:YhcN/YlaJ family sporulation lipoprotein [Aquisalibacillus elongatus]RPF50133.1 YhcN/YlaJ family sporulation lipoprotein [Aquisalibacillus elongatus]
MRFLFYLTLGASIAMLGACQDLEDQGLNTGNDDGLETEMLNTDGDGVGNQRQYRDDYRDRNNMNDNNQERTNRLDMIDLEEDRDQEANNGENNYEVANRAADKIANELNEIDDAYVLAGDNNAYVAVELENDNENNEVDEQVKDKVADVVKNTNEDIDNVYVSANPQFFDMVNNYVDDVRNGDPVEGFFEEFNDMLNRIFPDLNQ